MVAFAIAPDAMASMIAPRLDPKPEMRMTSLDVMVGECVHYVLVGANNTLTISFHIHRLRPPLSCSSKNTACFCGYSSA